MMRIQAIGRATRMTLAYAVLIVGALVMITPFLWSISTSLKLPAQVFSWPPVFIPNPPHFDSYREILTGVNFGLFTWNTFKLATIVALGQVAVCSLSGYAFAKLRFPGKDLIFIGYLATMMVPGAVTMIPNFILMRTLGWVDSHTSLIVPGLASAYGTFLMRQFFLTFPRELEDAAKLDGCSPLSFFWHIILPNSRPIVATLGVMAFQGTWNDFLWPLIMLNSERNRTLQIGLSYFQNEHYAQWGLLMAGSVITVLPLIVLFFFAQRQFIQSIKLTGLKG
jgi:multiple sugar transport system permease protein